MIVIKMRIKAFVIGAEEMYLVNCWEPAMFSAAVLQKRLNKLVRDYVPDHPEKKLKVSAGNLMKFRLHLGADRNWC